jgi:hypothetical protein
VRSCSEAAVVNQRGACALRAPPATRAGTSTERDTIIGRSTVKTHASVPIFGDDDRTIGALEGVDERPSGRGVVSR